MLFLALFLCMINTAAGQYVPRFIEEEAILHHKRESVVLLENKDNFLPIKDIEKLSIGVWQKDKEAFLATAKKYAHAERIKGSVEKNEYQVVFVAASANDEAKAKEFIAQLPTGIKIVYCFFGPTQNFNPPQVNAIFYCEEDDGYSYSLAIQKSFGGANCNSQLDKKISTKYPDKSGLTLPEKTRIGFLPNDWYSYQNMDAKISKIVQEGIEAEAFPGAQILVIHKAEVVYHKTFGFHTYKQKKPVEKENIYDFASITKVTTALPALMKLYDEGKFDLNARFDDYVPMLEGSNKGHLDFRNILAHNAQLQAWIPYWKTTKNEDGTYLKRTLKTKQSRRYPTEITKNLYLYKKYKQKSIYPAIKDSPLNEKVGYKYSGLPFYLFPEMIENLSGKPFEEYLKKEFYEPLGAYSLTYNPLRFHEKENILPTEKDDFFRMEQIHGTVHDEGAILMGGISSNAGLFGNALDLGKLAQMYLNNGSYGGRQFIRDSTLMEFTSCQYCETGNRRGLGFDKPLLEYHPENSHTAKSASKNSYGHSGYTGTYMWIDPDKELVFIFLSNRVYPTRDNRKLYQLNIRPRIQQAVYDGIERNW